MNALHNIKNSAQVHMSLFELEQIQTEVEAYERKIIALEEMIDEKCTVITMIKVQRSWPSMEYTVSWGSVGGRALITEMEQVWKKELEQQFREMSVKEFKEWKKDET